jgi:DNA polymerase-1
MRLLFDIETDSVEATKLWCIVAKDIDTNQLYIFGPDQLHEGCTLLNKADELIGHNIIGFDIPVIESLTTFTNLSEGKKITDTLVLSRLFRPSREAGHGLNPWGTRLGFKKIEFENFETFSSEMLDYCIQDVELNHRVYNALKEESKGFSKDSVELEHEVYKIIKDQQHKGFYYNAYESDLLLAELREQTSKIEDEVKKVFKAKVTSVKLIPKYTKTGKLSKLADTEHGKGVRMTEQEYNSMLAGEEVCRVDVVEFNLNSRQQTGEYLIEFGWKPKEFTPNGRPIVNEKTLSKIKNIKEADLMNSYLMLQKRVSQIESWNKFVGDDSRVHGWVITNGAITGRMTHRDPNMAQVPACSSPYGKECRSLWTVPNGYKLVGIDASGLELRMLASYMNDEEYTNEILNGDIHTANQKLAGLESRSQAKTFIYALLYGAGDAKLGAVVGRGREAGKRLRESFFASLPSFKTLKDRVSRASARGYLKGLDGRKLLVRSEHSALNTLLQGAGAITMKKALVIFNRKLKAKELDARFVANVHDEWQLEVREDQADEVGRLGVQSIREVTCAYELTCPLDGEYNVGNNWAETH